MTSAFSNNMPSRVTTVSIPNDETFAYLDRLQFAASEAARTFEDAGDAMSWSPTVDAINRLKEVLQGGYEYHPDDSAVDRFAEAMRDKMEESREKGRSGWDSPFQCSPYRLATRLIDHIAKGDPVDIGNFAMMLFNRPDARGVLARVWALRFDQIAASPEDARDAKFFRWLTADLAGDERQARNALLERMAVMSYSAACANIDAAMSATPPAADKE